MKADGQVGRADGRDARHTFLTGIHLKAHFMIAIFRFRRDKEFKYTLTLAHSNLPMTGILRNQNIYLRL